MIIYKYCQSRPAQLQGLDCDVGDRYAIQSHHIFPRAHSECVSTRDLAVLLVNTYRRLVKEQFELVNRVAECVREFGGVPCVGVVDVGEVERSTHVSCGVLVVERGGVCLELWLMMRRLFVEKLGGCLGWGFPVGFVVDDVVRVWSDDEVVDESADGSCVEGEFDVVFVVGVLNVEVGVEVIEVVDG